MPRADHIYTNFSVGELSPLMTGRVDTEQYNSAVSLIENFYVKPHGPAVRRGGSRYIAKAKLDTSYNVRLFSFVVKSTEQFVLEIGDQYIRFYTEHGQLVRDAANPPEGEPYEIATPYSHTDVFSLSLIQDQEKLYIAHNDYEPRELIRVDTYEWQLNVITFTAQPPEWVPNNYPGVVGIHQQRLYLGATRDQGQTFWGSRVGDYTNFTIATGDDDAFKYTIATDKDNRLLWFDSGQELFAGTRGSEFKIGSTDFKEAITPTNIRAVRQTNYGSKKIPPFRIGNQVLFVQKGGQKVRALGYSLESDSHIAEDLTFFSEHITVGGLVDGDYQNEPDSVAWYVRKDGQLIGITYEPAMKLVGCFRYKTKGQITSVAVIDGYFDVAHDEVWVAVDRVIGGQPAKFIEVIEPSLKESQDVTDSFYVDSGLSLPPNQLPATIITGLDHLESETVKVLVDGWVHPDQVVVGGQITLNQPATISCHVGLEQNSFMETLSPEIGNPIGTAQGKTKRVPKTQIRLYRSVGLKVGPAGGPTDWDNFGPPVMNQAVELFTGDREVDIDGEYDLNGTIRIEQIQPLPTTILCVMPEIRVEPGG